MIYKFTFTFTSRETYLDYKEDWKRRYAEQSKEQRRMKHVIREIMRDGKPAYKQQWDYLAGIRKIKELSAERSASKEEAGRQWEAIHKL